MSTRSSNCIDWYDSPLYYDIVFDEDTGKECNFIETMHHWYGLARGWRALEPACGTGRLLAELAKRGYRVAGFDVNPEMLRYARRRMKRRNLSSRIVEGRMEHFEFPRKFDFAYNLVSTFKYLLTERDARSHLQCVARVLKVGGIYVLGFHLTDYDDVRKQRERWLGKRGDIQVTCNIQAWPADRRRRLERVRSRLIIERRGQILRQESSWWFRTYSARQFRSLLRTVPQLEHVETYDFTYDTQESRAFGDDQLDCIVILRKRTAAERSRSC